jgi:hypothetical protein
VVVGRSSPLARHTPITRHKLVETDETALRLLAAAMILLAVARSRASE